MAMTELVLDKHSLLHLARAIQVRTSMLDNGDKLEDADRAFAEIFYMPYRPDHTIPALEEYPDLNARLIDFLEVELFEVRPLIAKAISSKKLRQRLQEAREKSYLRWEQFEFLRRMAAFDAPGLRLKSPLTTPITPI